MDFKNIKWAGKFYQKFEAMCLEIDGATFEDTVKYVENQKQKVGETVKKLYSEIMGDLLPLSSADPVNVTAGDLSLKPYPHIDTNKITNLSLLEDEKISEDEVKSSIPNPAYHLSPQTSNKLKEYQQRSKKCGPHRRPIVIKRIPQNSRTTKSSSFSEDRNATSTSELLLSHQPKALLKSWPSSYEKVSTETSGQKKNDFECASPASEIISSAEYMQQNQSEYNSPALDKDGSDSTSSGRDSPSELIDMPLNTISFSQSSPSSSSACEVEITNMEVMATKTDASMKDGSFSQFNISSSIECANEEVIVPSEGDCASEEDIVPSEEMKIIENGVISEPTTDHFSLVESSKLEEDCVLVEKDELYIVERMDKQKPYMKKIRIHLSSKLKSTMKQDQLVCESVKNNNTSMMMDTSEEISTPARDSFESEWELI